MDLREVTEFLRDAGKYIISLAVLVVIFIFIITFQPVAGNSMHPTLEEGNVIVVSKLAYKLGSPKRNEIAVVKDSNNKSFVKRIIGLPGEKIDYLNGVLYINDKPYKETFISDTVKTHNFLFEDICSLEDCPDGIIPEDMYMVLGDNRPESVDSRDPDFGLLTKKQIKGKMLFRIWPLNKIGGVK